MSLTRKTVRIIHPVAAVMILVILIGSLPGMLMICSAAEVNTGQPEPLHLKILLVRTYLDGEVSEEIIHENVWSIENFWAKYDQWDLQSFNGLSVVFAKHVDDISPLLKANGYFGITDKGVLTIFNGKPDQAKIIHSFFQIDVKKLESKKQEDLIHGIPIKTKDHFVEVLETFKPYSMIGKQTK